MRDSVREGCVQVLEAQNPNYDWCNRAKGANAPRGVSAHEVPPAILIATRTKDAGRMVVVLEEGA